MKALKHSIRTRILGSVAVVAFCVASTVAPATTVNAIYNASTDVPVTANSYTATGNAVNFTLNLALATGTELVVVRNTGLGLIKGTFDNLAQGQTVVLTYGGVVYSFVANYHGGRGNDLSLVWANNRPLSWGFNSDGQLGDNTTTDHHVPVAVNAAPGVSVLYGKTVVSTAAGYDHSLALCSDGLVAAWGKNYSGRLGDNTTTDRHVPVPVNRASGVSALYGKTVVAVAAGYEHSLALCSDGAVAAWGNNSVGQLGDNTVAQRHVPVAVNRASGVSALYGKTVIAIAAGWEQSLALCSDGTVTGWGWNDYGQLGDNTATSRPVPVAVTATGVLAGKTVVAIAMGGAHSLALCSDGTVATWGWNCYGQLGDNTTTDRLVPVAVNAAPGTSALSGKVVVAIAAGHQHSLALCSDGTVVAWGRNDYGQIGDNTLRDRPVPVAVNTLPGVSAMNGRPVVAITAGSFHSLALCSDGTVAAWGINGNGQLGDNTATQRNVPVALNSTPLAAGERFTRISSGPEAHHALALVAAPPATGVILTAPHMLSSGALQFAFTNYPGALFDVLATENLALPLSNWTLLGGAAEVTPGQFQFTDRQATSYPQRFYRASHH